MSGAPKRRAAVNINPLLAMNEEALWTAKEVAFFLKCSVNWVYLHSASGTLPHVKVGGLLRFVPEAIKDFVLKGRAA